MPKKDPVKAKVDALRKEGLTDAQILTRLGGELPKEAAARPPRGAGATRLPKTQTTVHF